MTVEAHEAKTHLLRLLDELEAGKTITITRHGVPVARLVPVPDSAHRDVRETIRALRAFRRGKTLGDLTVRDLIEERRRH